jgi:hypothetical protein
LAGHIRQWRLFWDAVKPQTIDTELTVVNPELGYAGTLDLLAVVDLQDGTGPQLAVGDYKTGKRIYPAVALQLAALANATHVLRADGSLIEFPAPRRDLGFAVQIRPRSWHAYPVQIDVAWRAFKALAIASRWPLLHAGNAMLADLNRPT